MCCIVATTDVLVTNRVACLHVSMHTLRQRTAIVALVPQCSHVDPCKHRAGPGLPERKSKPRYVHIESALASGSSVRWTRHGSKTRICSRAHWQAQRDHAYHLNGMTHTPVRAQARMLISVLYKPKEDKRRMLISEPVLRAVRERYPDADIEVHDAMAEKPDVQLRWLGRTTILITNIGSASFRLLYLPDGAQVRSGAATPVTCRRCVCCGPARQALH